MRRNLLLLFSCEMLFAHGLHQVPIVERDPVPISEMSPAIVVKRAFPLDIQLCAEKYDAHQGSCFVEFTHSLISHLDYAFNPLPLKLPNGDRVKADANERGYWLYYFGDLPTKEEQLRQIASAIETWSNTGFREVTVQLFRPSQSAPAQLHPFKETKMGDLVGVKRKIPIRYAECEKKFDADQCWVRIQDESIPDHPGPSGGGNISKEYIFSSQERVLISLENLYSDYLIYYEGPETERLKILAKIQTAISKLKGSAKELYLECSMFTLKRNKPLPNDKLVSKATFFEIEMPLTYEICSKSLDVSNQNCKGNFIGSPTPNDLDHPGGGEVVYQDLGLEGSFDILSTYVAGDPLWRLYYERKATAILDVYAFLERGFEVLEANGKNKIHGYGFHSLPAF